MNSENSIFESDKFHLDCDNKHQRKYFSWVWAQHQGSGPEREIQTIIYTERTFMIHYYLHWKDHGAYDISRWYFSVNHSVCLHNWVPNYRYGITPLELLTTNKANHSNLRRSNVWACPVFVLDPKLQNYQKIPNWNRRSCLGQLIWFSRTSLFNNYKRTTS